MITSLIKRFSNIVPQTCVLCDEKINNFHCQYQQINLCSKCINLLPIKHDNGNDFMINNIKIIAPYLYETPIDYFISQLKFSHQLIYANILGNLLADYLQRYYVKHNLIYPKLIIPIPLHKQRLQDRGFNQSLEIAKPISKKLRIKLDQFTCQRLKYTQQQSLLSLSQRKINIKNAFFISHKNLYKLKNKHVAIIDDVITSGNTMQEFCTCLYNIGVTKIDIWSVAHG